ncbi:ImmA/IrrE family metallo-endopeptidase [Faecalicatena contorta]|uniref:ImmA/IrrE family metallo-endopeptidase n=1 Tax=Faecalicatena contorta TaxID=39482 RepID=UPI003216F346
MDTTQIVEATIRVYKDCHVKSFPIDCVSLLEYYGYRIFTYDDLWKKSKKLYDICLTCSEDAFRDGTNMIIAYNSHNSKGRIRFSLMHELGHHVLGHTGNSDQNEQEANAFASHILAPRMAIHYSKCKNAEDVSQIFDVSHNAAAIAFDSYRRWHRRIVTYKMSYIDKLLYGHFYDSENNCFVWNIKECSYCGAILYNSISDHCKACCVPEIDQKRSFVHQIPMYNIDMDLFRRLENNWLYGGL